MTDQAQQSLLRPLDGNPLLEAFASWLTDSDASARARAVAQFGFAVPSREVLDAIVGFAPAGMIELGAGTGYWARLLARRGVAIVAYDVAPPPSTRNHFFAGVQPWFDVAVGDEQAVADHADRTLLLVWPTQETWAADALRIFHAAGGERVAYVGEGPGGRMGDEQFHALLGLSTGCLACDYGTTNTPCLCATEQAWDLVMTVAMPHWGGYDDDLWLFERRDTVPRAASRFDRGSSALPEA